jgi:geranylgeranyl reductase family protein
MGSDSARDRRQASVEPPHGHTGEVWDVVVVGAGPAGSAAALSALATRPDARVLLLDRAEFPRDKPCGDGVAPHAVDVLERLGAGAVTAGYPPVARLRLGFADSVPVAGTMRRPAHVIPRAVLDARLAEAAVARGATLRRHRVRAVQVRGGAVVLDGELRARVVVGADGAQSVVRRQVAVPGPRDGHVALAVRGYAPVPANRADTQVITFADSGWPAYAWSFPIGNGQANVGYGELLRGAAPPSRSGLLARLHDLLPGAGDGAERWRAHLLPLSSGRPRQPDGPVLLAGDALSLVNPLTGEGIYYAVLSGALAGRAAVGAGDPGSAYRQLLRAELGRHLRHTSVAAALARRRRVVDAGVAAARADGRVFDDLVELGLGRGLIGPRMVRGLLRGAVTGVR